MELRQEHIDALRKAETLIFHSDFCPYLELKELLRERTTSAQARSRLLFTNFYGLNRGRLTDEFLDRFFDILFSGQVVVNGQPAFSEILTELYGIERKRRDHAMPYSFVSKLVSMHCECSPIYDQYVRAFFRVTAPAASVKNSTRIAWFIGFLDQVAKTYRTWATDERIQNTLEKLRARDPGLSKCHEVRLLDFLVWKVGNQKLLTRKP